MDGAAPKVVIYMSCYNHEKYVGEAMDSIIGQTYGNWELYVVNDGSTDKTGDILASYQDERIHFYNFKENTKFIGAIKFLIEICREVDADYIASMASDDIWDKERLEKQINFMQKCPEYQSCFTWDKVIFSDNAQGIYQYDTTYSHKKNRNRYEWLNFFLINGNCLNECSMLMRKETFYEFGGKNQNYYQISDYRLWYSLCTKYPFYLLEEELVCYRRHGANLSERTVEVIARNINELYQMEREIIIQMDKRTFRRAFYAELPYVLCDTEEELLAEKFILLLGKVPNARSVKEQIAMDIYFANCRNEKFITVLKENYYYSAQDFLELTGKGGILGTALQESREQWYTPAFVMINAIDSRKINESSLNKFRYSTLFDLWELTEKLEEERKYFEQIRTFIFEKQNERIDLQVRKRILFLIAETSQYDLSSKIKEAQENGSECFVAFVPTTDKLMNGNYDDCVKSKQIEGAEVFSLCNRQEHCLYFLFELNRETDCIYYIDCIDKKYDCNHMTAGYPLSVEYHCILKNEDYRNIAQDDSRIFSMMKSIEVYE